MDTYKEGLGPFTNIFMKTNIVEGVGGGLKRLRTGELEGRIAYMRERGGKDCVQEREGI